MMTALPTARPANGLEGPSAGRTVDNATPQGSTYRRGNSVQSNGAGSLVRYSELDTQILIRAVAATFDRRQTGIPNGVPVGLSDEFANDPLKEKQWNAFLRKNSIAPKPLSEVVTDLRDFLMPVLALVGQR